MDKILMKSKKPHMLSENEKSAVIQLHQQFFDLKAEDIIGYLKERTYVDLFYEKKTKRLIGTVGIQWYLSGDAAIVYVGNAVIEKNNNHRGLLTRSVLKAVCKTSLKFPFKRKFLLGLATSPKAYAYFTKYKYSWPKPFEIVPDNINKVMRDFLINYYPENHQAHEHGYIVVPAEAGIRAKGNAPVFNCFQESWFTCSNIAYEEGYQLPCIASINASNYWVLIKSVLNIPRKTTIKRSLLKVARYVHRYKDCIYLTTITILVGLLYFN